MKLSAGVVWSAILVASVSWTATGLLLANRNLEHLGERPWHGFDVVLVRRADLNEAARRMDAAGFAPLHIGNAGVWIQDFSGGERILLSDIDRRFDQSDPRLDPFVLSASQLFDLVDHPESTLVYVERNGPIGQAWLGLRRAMGELSFQLVGWSLVAPVAALSAFLLGGLPILFGSRKRFVPRLLCLVLFAVLVFASGPAILLPAFLMWAALSFAMTWSFDLEREWASQPRFPRMHGGWFRAAMFMTTGLTTGIVIGPNPSEVVATLISSLFVWAAAAAANLYRIQRLEHRPFVPRPIMGHTWRLPGMIIGSVTIVAAAFSLPLLSSRLNIEESAFVRVPMPQAPHDGIFGPDPLADPLSTAGFLAHQWYHENFAFGARFEVPVYGEELDLQRLDRSDIGLQARAERIARFDTAWINQTLTVHDTEPSVYALFSREPDPVVLVEQPSIGSIAAPASPWMVVSVLVMVFSLTAPIRLPYRKLLGTVGASTRSHQNAS